MSTRLVNLFRIPGSGVCRVEVQEGDTWVRFVERNRLFDRTLTANSKPVQPSTYHEEIPPEVRDVYAVEATKGNQGL